MSYQIEVENIKCGGCANTIRKKLVAIEHVNEVEIDIESGVVTIEGDGISKSDAVAALAHLGYPEVGSLEGLKAATTKAKSFVSCAVGRMDRSAD